MGLIWGRCGLLVPIVVTDVRLTFPAMSTLQKVLVSALHQGLVISVCRMWLPTLGL